ncbi:hypothetical protein FACS189413_05610 [Bacteroidia bacterium]|nr:hypothetical protein FACS189413_05610 [Bacteroidia bacterium]
MIYIAPIDDGAFGGKAYYGSGKSVANYFLQYFRSDASDVIVGAEDTVNADYIVKAVITHWEPRAAAWSGIPTRVEILVSVYNANSKEKIIDDKLSVTGRSFTFVNQSAEGLAEYLIKEFCNENIRK